MSRSIRLALAGLALAACSSRGSARDRPGPPAGPAAEAGVAATGDLRVLAEATCPGAGVTAVWLGVEVADGLAPARGLRRLELRRADRPAVVWREVDDGADWPEVVFAPDCARVAVLLGRTGPYVVVPTVQLVALAEGGAAVDARYLDDQEPCALAFVYSDLRWRSATEVEYRSGGEPFATRVVDVTRAPTTVVAHPCRDPGHALYQPP